MGSGVSEEMRYLWEIGGLVDLGKVLWIMGSVRHLGSGKYGFYRRQR